MQEQFGQGRIVQQEVMVMERKLKQTHGNFSKSIHLAALLLPHIPKRMPAFARAKGARGSCIVPWQPIDSRLFEF